MPNIAVVGSIAVDEVVRLDAALQRGGHNQGSTPRARVGGGGANTAMALARAGDHAVLFSAVSADDDGDWLVDAVMHTGVDVSCIDRGSEVTTRSLVLAEPEGERTIVNLRRAGLVVPPDLLLSDADAVYVRSRGAGLAPALARAAAVTPVVAHVPPLDRGARPAHVLVGSADDIPEAFLEDPFRNGRRVAGAILRWVVTTRGAAGAVAYGEKGWIRVDAPSVEVVDSTGAGDVFAAGLVHALAGSDLSEAAMTAALEVGVSWGAESVTYEGSVPPPGFPSGTAPGRPGS